MPVSTYIDTSEKLSAWDILLHTWIKNVNRYCDCIPNDNPYWHGEQTNVAFLTGVAFQLPNWFSLTEFPSAKDELSNAYGRNDAWLKNEDSEYYIEAKQLWPELAQDLSLSHIPAMMAAAEQAARQVRVAPLPETPESNVHRVALVFISPRFSPQPDFALNSALERVQVYLRTQQYDALAWTFPRNTISYKSLRTNRMYPGVILLARVIS
jgi:hypothetical protein